MSPQKNQLLADTLLVFAPLKNHKVIIMTDENDMTQEDTLKSLGETGVNAVTEHATAESVESGTGTHQPNDSTVDSSPDLGPESINTDASSRAQDSEEPTTMKEEASNQDSTSKLDDAWKKDLKRYLNDMNGVLAAKENLKLVWVDKRLNPAYAINWKIESNRYFQLMVNLRRRSFGTKMGGKSVS